MKVLVVLSVLVAVAFARPDGDHYDTKYDDFDVETVTKNDRLLKAYVQCLLSKGSCTPEGTSFKKVLPEALATSCSKCNEKQKAIVRKVIKAVQEKLPEEWEALVQLHDPEGKYKESFSKFLLASD